eukprot:553525-Amphidinium_carterae.1
MSLDSVLACCVWRTLGGQYSMGAEEQARWSSVGDEAAFPLTPWDALLTQVGASADVKALWDQAVQVFGQWQEKPCKKFPLDSFCTVSGRGYRCERFPELRAKQGEEIAEWFREDECRARPGLFKHQTTDRIQAVAEKIQAAQVKQELVVTADDAAVAASEAQKEKEKEEEEDESEEIEEIGASPNALLESATSAKLGKKRGRGKGGKGGRGKGKGGRGDGPPPPGLPGRGQKRARQQQQQHPQQQTSAGHTSTRAPSTTGSPSSDTAEACRMHQEKLDIERMLAWLTRI